LNGLNGEDETSYNEAPTMNIPSPK